MKFNRNKPLTFDDLANIYDLCHSGRPARTLPLDYVTKWATKSKLIRYDKKKDLFFRR